MTSIHFVTQGCSANQSDTEVMKGLLKEAQFVIENSVESADIIVFNTCTVKNPSESTFFRELEKIKIEHPYKTIIVTGCIAQSDSKNPLLKDYCLVGTRQIHRIVEVVEEALNDNIIRVLEKGEMPPLNLPKVRKNPVVGIIQINLGCLGGCTFCKTKSARFNLRSYPIEDIVSEAKTALKDGVKEIWLTSQDTFCYGFDIGTDIVELLEALVAIPENFKIRVGMGNPDHLPKVGVDRLIQAYQTPKIFQFLHLPLQAGHNKTLEEMKRLYTVQQFIKIVNKFKESIPEINIMTDVIVGYPTETDEHFWGTLEAVKRTQPDSVNISRFWPRPGTKAAKLKPLPGEVMKHRSKMITEIFHNISKINNERWLGWEGEIIVDEKGKQEGQWTGRNYCYKPVIVEGDYQLGQKLKVKVTKAKMFDLRAEVV